ERVRGEPYERLRYDHGGECERRIHPRRVDAHDVAARQRGGRPRLVDEVRVTHGLVRPQPAERDRPDVRGSERRPEADARDHAKASTNASGSVWATSIAVMGMPGPAAMRPAVPCSQVAVAAIGPSSSTSISPPWARATVAVIAPIAPASTSPVPAVASHGVPVRTTVHH